MKILHKFFAGLFFYFFIFSQFSQSLYAEENTPAYKPREPNLLIDIPLTIAEDMTANLFGNVFWRLFGPDAEAAYFTADSMRANLNPKVWSIEAGQGGDIFLVNQFAHPYAGGIYFASARSNNFNFYWSILSSTFGSLSWEALGEKDTPAWSDSVNTALGGIALGEIMHRLYLELDKGGAGGKIAGTLLSPTDRITAAVRGYGPEPGPSKIYDASFAAGLSWSNAQFLEENDVQISWNKPSGFINIDLIYGDPFIQSSKIPFDHFEVNLMLAVSVPLMYNFNFTSDGYLASWLLADDEKNLMSNGITLHFDDYIVDKNLDMNNGSENIGFNANSLDYTVKWLRYINSTVSFSLKFHIGFTPWAVADYNGGINRDDYNCYLIGGNIKLALELRQITGSAGDEGHARRGQFLTLNMRYNNTWNIPRTPGFQMNAVFSNTEVKWVFPLTQKLSLYAADSFSILHCNLTRDESVEFPDITRWYNCAQIGVHVSL